MHSSKTTNKFYPLVFVSGF